LADIKPLQGRSNIHLLGEQPYENLHEYLSVFDVCIIPFIKNSLTDATNPVKLYEFLSAGKPIVATRLNEISIYQDYIHLAGTFGEWELAIKESLSEEKTDELLTHRYEFARSNTWKLRAEVFESKLIELFPKISIIVVTYNKLDYTKMCLESIITNTEYPNYEIVIVDNASVDGSVEYIRNFKNSHNNVKFIRNDNNLGFAVANNLGASVSNGDYLLFLNNDTIVTPGWLHRLLFHLNANPTVGMVGPVTNAIGNEAKVEIDYSKHADINYFAAKRAEKYAGISFEIKVLALYCSLISQSLFHQLRGLDECYQIGMFEDDDLALKIQQAGLTLLCAEDVFIHHFHGVSFNQFENQELQQIFHENRKKFEQKWGVIWQPHQNRPHP
jgi:GT2 family glycosyltransferase